jgi:hypothetical protein
MPDRGLFFFFFFFFKRSLYLPQRSFHIFLHELLFFLQLFTFFGGRQGADLFDFLQIPRCSEFFSNITHGPTCQACMNIRVYVLLKDHHSSLTVAGFTDGKRRVLSLVQLNQKCLETATYKHTHRRNSEVTGRELSPANQQSKDASNLSQPSQKRM